MTECSVHLGKGNINFPCTLERGHDGPHYAIEIGPSVQARKKWNQEQQDLANSGYIVPQRIGDLYTDPGSQRDHPADVRFKEKEVAESAALSAALIEGIVERADKEESSSRTEVQEARIASACAACRQSDHLNCRDVLDLKIDDGVVPSCVCFQNAVDKHLQLEQDYAVEELPPALSSPTPFSGILIGLHGLPLAGKDTVGAILAQQYGFNRYAFGDKLRDWALAIDPMVAVSVDTVLHLSDVVDQLGWTEAKKNPEVRRILQRIGTELGREQIHEDIWINFVFGQLDFDARNVITDVRFPRDAERIKEVGGFLIKIERPGIKAPNNHRAEAGLPDSDFDDFIKNDGTLEDLKLKTKAVLGEILLARL